MDEDGDDSSPFWLHSTTKRRHSDRIRNGLLSLLFSSGLLIVLLLATAVSFLVFVVPSTFSFSAQIFRPTSVKKSWDSLNLLLVLFALVFGFLSRNKNDDSNPHDEYQTSPISDTNRLVYRSSSLTRSSSSYPDLREISSQMVSRDDPWRFSDDMFVDTYWTSGSGQFLRRRRSWKQRFDDSEVSLYQENTAFLSRSEEASVDPITSPLLTPPPPVSPPTPPPEPPVSMAIPAKPTPALPKVKQERSRRSRRERNKRKDIEVEKVEPISPTAAPTPAPPPPPPPPPLPQFADPKSSKSDKKRSGGSATKDFLNSLYHKKKKKQRQKSVENFESLLLHKQQMKSQDYQQQPPSPPPPPPQPSPIPDLFFSRKSIRRKKQSFPSTETPSSSHFLTVAMNPPPKAVNVSNFYGADGNISSGGESPMVRIPPPPPPPPPFGKSLAWKFVLQGDYVRVDSMASSRSGSPEPDDSEADATPVAGGGGDVTPLFCASPDVNAKAENFITNFWAGLKLEKIDSMKKRNVLGLSNLGRGLER